MHVFLFVLVACGSFFWVHFIILALKCNECYSFECIDSWLGSDNRTWDLVTFNFGLHSLDNPPTSETESIANYTRELDVIARKIKARAKRVIWVNTTPVPANVTIGPKRHNADVRRYNQAATSVMRAISIPTCDA